jgi:glycosyltransferase involved in cell wall biosynthesis
MAASIGLVAFRAVSNHQMIIPTKLFEYMGCALPVVAADLPPIRSYVTAANCGLLVPPEQPEAFVAAIEYLLDHPAEACQMGQNGRQAVLTTYNWQPEEQKLLALYQRLLH